MENDSELEELRKRKLEQLYQAQEVQLQRQQQEEQAKAQIEALLRPLLTQDAWEQWNTAKIASQQNAYTAAYSLIQAAQAGQIKGKISKEQIKSLLNAVYKKTHRETKIKRL